MRLGIWLPESLLMMRLSPASLNGHNLDEETRGWKKSSPSDPPQYISVKSGGKCHPLPYFSFIKNSNFHQAFVFGKLYRLGYSSSVSGLKFRLDYNLIEQKCRIKGPGTVRDDTGITNNVPRPHKLFFLEIRNSFSARINTVAVSATEAYFFFRRQRREPNYFKWAPMLILSWTNVLELFCNEKTSGRHTSDRRKRTENTARSLDRFSLSSAKESNIYSNYVFIFDEGESCEKFIWI